MEFEATRYIPMTIPYFAENGKNGHDFSATFNQPRPFFTTAKSRRLIPPKNRGRNKKALMPADSNRFLFSYIASFRENSSLPQSNTQRQASQKDKSNLNNNKPQKTRTPKPKPVKNPPENHGTPWTPWTPEAKNQLLNYWAANRSLDSLAAHLGRSPSSCQKRLKKLKEENRRLETVPESALEPVLRTGKSEFGSSSHQNESVCPSAAASDLASLPPSIVSATASDFSQNSQITRDSKTRAKDPIKNRNDLLHVNIECLDFEEYLYYASLPEKTTDLLKCLLHLNETGQNTMPHIIYEEVKAATVFPFIDDSVFTAEYHLPKEEALFELAQLQKYFKRRGDAGNKAVASYPGTTTFILLFWKLLPKLAPKYFYEATTTNKNGNRTVAKMIDYCLTLEPTENIRRICKHEPEGLGIFNQSMDESIRYNPIAITVDTKVETAASTGEPQLAIWTKA
ncbi:hypothetical protein F4860DRAFT_529430 [Xylaria cubensis]|nr:hypothetical protein F4860DRAFT_529430 [Xylaria cubensis]